MHSDGRKIGLALAVVGIVCILGASAFAQRPTGSKIDLPKFDEPADLANLPMLGRWKINIAKSTFNGSRANSDTFTWIFEVEGDKIRHTIYDEYPADKPSRSYAVKLNGTKTPDPHAPGLGETVSWFPINRSMMFREVIRKGVTVEHVIYEVSADGNVFTTRGWRAANPNAQGIASLMYFDRQAGPGGSN